MNMCGDQSSMDVGKYRCTASLLVSWLVIVLIALGAALSGCASVNADTTMVMLQPDDLKWGDPILPGSPLPAFEKGAKVAVLQGVQIGAADTARQGFYQYLAGARFRCAKVVDDEGAEIGVRRVALVCARRRLLELLPGRLHALPLVGGLERRAEPVCAG